jgi:hypothetical protein
MFVKPMIRKLAARKFSSSFELPYSFLNQEDLVARSENTTLEDATIMDRFINANKELLQAGEVPLKRGICMAYINLLQSIASNDN